MVMTPSPTEHAVARYGCVLCGRPFELPGTRPALPAHVYPSGLYRGRPCASTFGIRA